MADLLLQLCVVERAPKHPSGSLRLWVGDRRSRGAAVRAPAAARCLNNTKCEQLLMIVGGFNQGVALHISPPPPPPLLPMLRRRQTASPFPASSPPPPSPSLPFCAREAAPTHCRPAPRPLACYHALYKARCVSECVCAAESWSQSRCTHKQNHDARSLERWARSQQGMRHLPVIVGRRRRLRARLVNRRRVRVRPSGLLGTRKKKQLALARRGSAGSQRTSWSAGASARPVLAAAPALQATPGKPAEPCQAGQTKLLQHTQQN